MEFFEEKRSEVMVHIEKFMLEKMDEYLKADRNHLAAV